MTELNPCPWCERIPLRHGQLLWCNTADCPLYRLVMEPRDWNTRAARAPSPAPAPVEVTEAMVEAADAAWSASIGHDGLTMRGRIAIRAAIVAALAAGKGE